MNALIPTGPSPYNPYGLKSAEEDAQALRWLVAFAREYHPIRATLFAEGNSEDAPYGWGVISALKMLRTSAASFEEWPGFPAYPCLTMARDALTLGQSGYDFGSVWLQDAAKNADALGCGDLVPLFSS